MATTTKQNIRSSSVKYVKDKQELNVKFTEDHIKDHIKEPIKENRRLTSTTGVKTVLAVRITTTNTMNSFTEEQLKDRVFTKGDNWKDNWTLANAMSKCSFGKLEITGGVVTVEIDNDVEYERFTRHSFETIISSIKDDAKKNLTKNMAKISTA